MKISFAEIARRGEPVDMTIHSLDQALYQVTLLFDGRHHLLVEREGKTFRRRSLQAVREALQSLPVASLRLRQQSAYDEMIGQPARVGSNALDLPLSLEQYPPPRIH